MNGKIGGKAGKGVSRNKEAIRPYVTLRNLLCNPSKRGSENKLWKGDTVGYGGIHTWVKNNFVFGSVCEKCGATKNLHISNKDHQYKRVREDWWILCAKCHKRHDVQLKLNGVVTRKKRLKQKAPHL